MRNARPPHFLPRFSLQICAFFRLILVEFVPVTTVSSHLFTSPLVYFQITMSKITVILLVLAAVIFSSAMAAEEEKDIFYLRGEHEGELIGEGALRDVSSMLK